MPYKEKEINKLYYTMGEVTKMLQVNASQIRFYEREFAILQPKKNKKGDRFFSSEDIETLKLILHLTKHKGFTLTGAKAYIKNNKDDLLQNQKIINALERIKAFLLQVQKNL